MSGPQASDRSPAPRFAFRALLLYATVWVALTAAVAFAVISVLDGEETVTLPPVRAIELTAAAEAAGCVLSVDDHLDASLPLSGASRRAAEPGFYDDPLPEPAVVGALRRGLIVIHYRRDLPADRIRELRLVQQAVPAGTIVAPNDAMRFAVAATVWQHLLGCAQWTDGTIDALRLFRGRYIGRGAGEL